MPVNPRKGLEMRQTVRRWIGFIEVALIAAILCSAFICPRASAADYSNWLKNLSAATDPDRLYNHGKVKIAVSGSYVHVVWLGFKKDWSGSVLFYRRSTDGGKTFEAPRQIAKDSPGERSLDLLPESHNVAADGAYVYILVTIGPPYYKLVFLRSADNGATFDNPVTWSSGGSWDVHIAAENGKIAAGYAINNGAHAIACKYSSDGGVTFNTTTVAYSDVNNPGTVDGMGIRGFGVADAARSGDNVYLLATVSVDNGTYSPPSYYYIHASNDGGKTFKSPALRVSVVSANGRHYTTGAQDQDYSPNLAASGNDVHVVWVNNDNRDEISYTLRVRKSSDGGATLSDPITLYKYPDGYHSGAQPGLETIWRSGNNVYVVTSGKEGFSGTYLWRSTDAGATWEKMQKLSAGGWWPHIQVDPSNSARVHVVHSWYYLSTDGGVTFNGGANPHYNFNNWQSPQFAVGSDGAAHYVGASGPGAMSDDNEIFYRRMVPEPAPGTSNKAVSLTTAADGRRNDNIQIPASPDINFSSAMTAEVWVKRTGDDWQVYNPFLIKRRSSGWESYSIGTGDNFQIYCRITTDKATDSVWLGSSTTLHKGVWTHIALTYDAKAGADNMRLYVNGMLAGKTTVTGAILTDTMDCPLVLGRDDVSYRSGEISVDELLLWSKARTQAEILADLSRQLTGAESGLAAYYNFNDTFKDITGHGNDGIPMYGESFVAAGNKPPYVISQSPANGAINVNPNANLIMTFNETVAKGTGSITITMLQGGSPGPIFETIDVTSSKVTVNGATVVIRTTNPFTAGKTYYVTMPNSCFTNANGDTFQGITSIVAWVFTTGTHSKKDLIGSWAGLGIYYRNSNTKAWTYLASPAIQVVAGDMDGDGKDDLIGLWSDGAWVKYSATGSWLRLASPATWIAAADMNGDGRADLLGIWESTVYLRDSVSGSWSTLTTGATRIAAADMDGDGKADLVGQWASGIWVLLSSTGQWQEVTSSPDWFAVDDLNGDGRADFVGIWGSVVWALDSATGTWTNLTSGASKIALGDLDGDGKADLLRQWSDGIWVKYSSTGKWEWLSSSADSFAVGKLR